MGFPHSDIFGSKVARHLPEAYRRHAASFIASMKPRHPPYALNFLLGNLKTAFCFLAFWFASECYFLFREIPTLLRSYTSQRMNCPHSFDPNECGWLTHPLLRRVSFVCVQLLITHKPYLIEYMWFSKFLSFWKEKTASLSGMLNTPMTGCGYGRCDWVFLVFIR